MSVSITARRSLRAMLLASSIAIAMPALADVSVTGAWVRGTVTGQKTTGAFMQLSSPIDTALIAVTSPVAKIAEVHEMKMEGGMMKMKAVDKVAIPAGKPVEFTFMSYPTTESRTLGEALQAQLSAYDNVEMNVEVVDFAAATARAGARDFDMVITSAIVQDPDFGLWTAFHSASTGNFTGIDDKEG